MSEMRASIYGIEPRPLTGRGDVSRGRVMGTRVRACANFHKRHHPPRTRRRTRMDGWLPILLLTGFGFSFAAGNIFISQFLGPRNPTAEKLAPYECGMPPVGDARERMSVRFYLVAMIFLLFDIEVAFLYPWAPRAAVDRIRADFRVLPHPRRRLRVRVAEGRAGLEYARLSLAARDATEGPQNHG